MKEVEIVIWKRTGQINGNDFEDMDRIPEVDDTTLTISRVIQIKSQFILWKNYKTEKCNGKLGVYFVRIEKVGGKFFCPSCERYRSSVLK